MKILILGGGLTALSAANILSDEYDVTILEKDDELGGLAASFKYQNYFIPMHYHHIFHHDEITKKFFKTFRIPLKFKKIKMAILTNNKIYNFTNPLALLTFDYLSLWGRIRYGLFGFYVFFLLNPNKIPDSMDAEIWLNKTAGRELTKKLFTQLYARNKFNIPLAQISAKQFANRLKAKEALGNFGYPPGKYSLQSLINALESRLTSRGVKIVRNCEVKKITPKKVETSKGKFSADIILNTLPIPVFREKADLSKEYLATLSKIEYCSCVTVIFGADRFLTKHYWLNLLNEPIHMVMQHSILADKYPEKIIWALRYGGSEEDLPLTDEQLKQKYLSVVKKYFPKINIKWAKVFRERYAEPVYNKDYFSYMPQSKTPYPWLYHAGISLTYPKIRTMNTAFESGIKTAFLIKNDLR